MTVFEELKLMNYSIIDCLKAIGANFGRNEIIKEILKDDACFFKMEKSEAMFLLKTLKVSDNMLEDTYSKLVNEQEYNRLINVGKIDITDTDLKIKYIGSKEEHIDEKNLNKVSNLPALNYCEKPWYMKLFYAIKSFFKK